MKKHILIFILALPSLGFGANFSLRPGFRKPVEVTSDLTNPFVGQSMTIITQDIDPSTAEPPGLKDLREFIGRNPINGIAWHSNSEFRSVLLGKDVILRIGGQIPRDYLPEGPSFILTDIAAGAVTFQPVGRKDYPIIFPSNLFPDPKSSLTEIPKKAGK